MATDEQRLTILRMIEEGKITAEEGARLLTALGGAEAEQEPAQAEVGGQPLNSSRLLRVRVSDLASGQKKVGVNIPVGLVSFGLRFVPDSAGVDVDAIRQAIDSGITGRIVDVTDEEDGKHVEVFIE